MQSELDMTQLIFEAKQHPNGYNTNNNNNSNVTTNNSNNSDSYQYNQNQVNTTTTSSNKAMCVMDNVEVSEDQISILILKLSKSNDAVSDLYQQKCNVENINKQLINKHDDEKKILNKIINELKISLKLKIKDIENEKKQKLITIQKLESVMSEVNYLKEFQKQNNAGKNKFF